MSAPLSGVLTAEFEAFDEALGIGTAVRVLGLASVEAVLPSIIIGLPWPRLARGGSSFSEGEAKLVGDDSSIRPRCQLGPDRERRGRRISAIMVATQTRLRWAAVLFPLLINVVARKASMSRARAFNPVRPSGCWTNSIMVKMVWN
ncbi:hypothetical protein OAG77_00180 [bacterium]|nr:hypothetical protein [bacterium]